ncbi:helix-turn-helix domain-containing protein [Convivina intestini]|uniref:Transcriptional regulator with XRE-family HTH domain n=1 Tax=Convivina intestini TaxID=1505726 RepID=A0A2U1D3F3_9LACO|nr:helix-turn-helix transcriptional regulator [Convivina intestini]PVY82205.1 transcriptional regulator with XRE-family HTH domain [Convivina intestini]CAH1857570.1 putative HTH-type transcriptional regulator [Convivina intestini]SDC22710.1 Transcriptional regulator, contains XRE-family HTH domain [Leuconostocaceae bacterium R-53105]
MVNSKDFGSKIKSIREDKHYSVRQAALQGGISPAYLSQVENGRKNIPKVETLTKIADGLRISKDEILRLAGIVPEPNIDEGELTDSQRKVAYFIDPNATDEEIEQIKKLVEIAKLSKHRL